ncbi:glycosyltransferase [Leptodesmis sichuanensis]|uniref:glycosyltransferase n=1 Tax=Leptodesmis sichuanensis TaxID=2906798 RepID=UPI001F44E3E1|nr:glycosyltransferase [Leptodesmis sichuanensis]UIE37304.1 glycosyltransferase [Leptodesmis sichuanensis A121]
MKHGLNPQSDVLVSVVSPICNAESWIGEYLQAISALLAHEYKDYEIVLVDNGSTDNTVAVVEQLQQELRNIQLYSLARSIPHESAFVVGLEQAIGDVVITLDAAYDPIDPILEMVQLAYSGVDIVYGLRSDRLSQKGGFSLYNWLSQIFFRFYRQITKENLPIAASTLRLYTRRAINSFLDNSDRYSLFPVIAAFSGLRYQTFTYQRLNRTGLPTNQSYSAAISRAFRLIFLSSHYPLRLLSFTALAGAFLNVIYSFYVLFVNLFKSKVAEGWTTLSLQNSVMFFILFMILAVLSEYIARLVMTNQNRPFYFVTRESRSLVLVRKKELNVVRNDLKS